MKHDKEKIKQAMNEYITSKGWPDMPNPDEFVMSQLDPMFKLLLSKNLVQYSDFDMYILAAEGQYMRAKGIL